jgi:hypothetical protein
MCKAQVEKSVMNVPPISRENRLIGDCPANHREHRIEDRDTQRHHGRENRHGG